jgi:acyl-CoA synthetase (AMP-forming)/AMP-acid ligase II
MLCKKRFLEGSLRAEFVKFFVRKSISMIPHGEDVIGGIWSPYVSELRRRTLEKFPNQISTVDYREKSFDEKTGAPLTDFKTIIDILKFRVASSSDSIAFHNIDNNGKISTKPITWKKFENRMYSVCQYFMEKSITPGRHVVLMYSLSEEFVIAVYACFMCGIIPIPMLPFDSNRIGEDFPAFVGVLRDFDINEIFVNEEVERFLKNGPIADVLKKLSNKRARGLKIKNTTKLTKVSSIANLNSKISKAQAAVNFRNPNTIALIWLNFTSDHYRVCATLSHKAIMGICKVFKETCNLSSRSSIVGCVRHSSGIGFIQAALLGVFLGTTTYLSSPVNFAENPLAFFLSLARYKVKDVFVTEQMLKYAAIKFTPKGFNLSHLKNMMISSENRAEIDFLRKIAKVFQPTKLGAASLATVFNHYYNPIISTRSYATVAPVDLYLDPVALRQGYISMVNQAEVPNALHIQDSGMVPVCTEIAIVNPETRYLCKEGEFGEIWVCSEANLTSFTNGPKGPVDKFCESQFHGMIADGNPDLIYLRTGELGFLHTISIAKNLTSSNDKEEQISSFQPLFVLGKISDTFEVMGLHHFPIDIENTIEACHHEIYKNGSCVFKCADYTIVVCESKRSRYFASLVPLIVNTVLSKHHIIVDIVAFIKKGEFPISRLGTKQRARIVDAWVQGVLPINALYGVNYGENSMIKLVKEIDIVARDHPITGLKNPAASYYDNDLEDNDDIFDANHQGLKLNDGSTTLERGKRAVFSMSTYSSSIKSEDSTLHQ